jgi:Ca-activated chloride channel family protein
MIAEERRPTKMVFPCPHNRKKSWNRIPRGFYGAAMGILLVAYQVNQAQDSSPDSLATTGFRGPSPLKVTVDLVLVNATVTDLNNRFVTGLEREHFQVFEDKIEQRISHFSNEDVPASIGLLFDVSNSMTEKLSRSKDAAIAFLKTSNPQDEFLLITFSDRPKVDEEFTSDIGEIQNRLAYKSSKGCTTLYDAVYLALQKLKKAHNPKKAILLITDGEDTCSRYVLGNVKNAVKEADVQIFAIGIVNTYYSELSQGRVGRAVLEEMAEVTGGKAYFPASVYELEDICTKIAIELKNQYILGYAPNNAARDGRWRKIRVKINAPKGLPTLSIRAKTGYYAPAG